MSKPLATVGVVIPVQATCPIPAGSNGLWVDSAVPNVAKFRLTGGTDTSLGAGGGSSALPPKTFFSNAELGKKAAAATQLSFDATDLAVGFQFQQNRSGDSMAGARFYFNATKSVKLSLWDNAGTRLANVTVSATAGINTGTFSSAVALTNGSIYHLTVWTTDSSGYYYLSAGNFSAIVTATPNGLTTFDNNMVNEAYTKIVSRYASGDAAPATTTTTLLLGCIEPVYSAVTWP